MKITENEKKEILSKYSGDNSSELLLYLKRHFPIYETHLDWLEKPLKFIKVEDKVRPFENNKKYLVDKISSIVESEWNVLGLPKIRKTIKKYLDGFK